MRKTRYVQIPVSKLKVGQWFWIIAPNKKAKNFDVNKPVQGELVSKEKGESYSEKALADLYVHRGRRAVTVPLNPNTRVWVAKEPKPRVRLMKIGECGNGQRAWRKKCLHPITVITVSKKKCEAIYHVGHAFNLEAKRLRMGSWTHVWAIVG